MLLLDEDPATVIQRAVVWMRGDSVAVKGDENVDRGRGLLLAGHGEDASKRVGHPVGIPFGRHAIGEVSGMQA